MNEKIDNIRLWIEKADHDLGTAQLTYLHIPNQGYNCISLSASGRKILKILSSFPRSSLYEDARFNFFTRVGF
jgi:hypothetical protein